jgi:hypothetical protein
LLGVAVATRFGGSLDKLPKFLLDTRAEPTRGAAEPSETSDGQTLH